jgi:hypothetical protein
VRKKYWALAFAAALGAAILAAPAHAGFYIGARGGLSNQNPSLSGSLGKIEFDRNSAFLYGVQVGFKFSALAVEGEYYRADHGLLHESSLQGGSDNISTEMDYHYLGVNAKLGIPLVILYPYVTVGYGKYSAMLSGFGDSSDFAINVGAGAELAIGRISIFAEVRYSDFGFDLGNLTWDFGGVDAHFGLNVHF